MSKRKVSYVQQEEPSFIRNFKAKVGFKEGPSLDAKRGRPPQEGDSDDDQPDFEDEKPQVVVLKPGDLSAAEAERLGFTNSDSGDEAPLSRYEGPAGKDADQQNAGRIVFKKPAKKAVEDDPEEPASKSKKDDKKDDKGRKKDKKKVPKNKSKKLTNTKLLSFNDDEEEDED